MKIDQTDIENLIIKSLNKELMKFDIIAFSKKTIKEHLDRKVDLHIKQYLGGEAEVSQTIASISSLNKRISDMSKQIKNYEDRTMLNLENLKVEINKFKND